ncbi:conserved hypothetical protein [Streptomyces pristinaespiralis ATCC 25486]|uniref:Uncharacterized protein n=2 Tax=Streptomyces pristinaespiralis TaxID=38300 RepID=B5HAJ8_STRE2|nr:hypothetical protein SPRI_1159 [Streptomyces pristinaespiralis]EDY63859.1 conserved hypothetical protein [Streptomyces pristinaespiralis ATCC 25486]
MKGVGPKTIDYISNLVGRSHVAVDVHLRTFAANAGVPDLTYERLRAAYVAAAALLGHDSGGLEHAVGGMGRGPCSHRFHTQPLTVPAARHTAAGCRSRSPTSSRSFARVSGSVE